MRKGHLVFAVFSIVGAVVACGGADVGGECGEEGKADTECVDGAVCGKNKAGALVCQTQCTTDVGCLPGETCGLIANTNLKGCRAK